MARNASKAVLRFPGLAAGLLRGNILLHDAPVLPSAKKAFSPVTKMIEASGVAPCPGDHGGSPILPRLSLNLRRFCSAPQMGSTLSPGEGTSSSSPEQIGLQRYQNIRVGVDGQVAIVNLARQMALNALSHVTMCEVIGALEDLDADPNIGAMVIHGEGKAFAAGADIKEMEGKTFEEAYRGEFLRGWDRLSTISKPIIAAVDGYALGGGCELAMMCDVILVGERAIFGQPEVKLGLIPGMGGTQRLTRAVGKSRAMEMILTGGAFLNAEEAVATGLASRLVKGEAGAVLAEAIALAERISRLPRPTIQLAKEAVNAAFESGLHEGLRRERALFLSAFALEDTKEGIDAFLKKREAIFNRGK